MRIGVLGGGIAGLACAHYLLKSGHTPIVFERSDQHGHLSQRLEHEGVGLDCWDTAVMQSRETTSKLSAECS
jgi:phytoene dehydrogenase-like protein